LSIFRYFVYFSRKSFFSRIDKKNGCTGSSRSTAGKEFSNTSPGVSIDLYIFRFFVYLSRKKKRFPFRKIDKM